MNAVKLLCALLGGASGLAMSAAATAQTPVNPAQATEAAPSAQPDSGADIVVTGSRVITNGNNSPTPLTVVDAQQLLAVQPGTVADALNTLPAFSGPRTQVSNPNTGIGAGGGGNAVANQLNLRNLGSQRTLVLFDGQRVAPTTSTGIVDVDMIPQFILKRVDVVTGGVSAVYGSDAVSGVVNFITDRDFNGLKLNLQTGVSSRNDGSQYEAAAAYGTRIGDRGHFVASYEFRKDDGILFRSERPQIHLWTMPGNGGTATPAVPYFLTDQARRVDVSFGGLIRSGPLLNQNFYAPGVLSTFNAGTIITTAAANTRLGGDGAFLDGSLKSPLRSHQAFARFDYDLTDNVHAYVQAAANWKRNEIYGQFPQLINVTLSARNAFLPASYQYGPADSLTGTSAPSTFTFGKFIRTAPRLHPVIDEQQIFGMIGLEGELGANTKWNVGYVQSRAKLKNTEADNIDNLKLSAALDAVTNPANGQIVCRVTLTNPTLFPGCVPLNVFGPGTESPAALDYIMGDTHFNAYTNQQNASASITGKPFSTWAGPVGLALSGEWRRQTYRSVSDTSVDFVPAGSCTGLRYNCSTSATAGTFAWVQTFPNLAKVSETVWEGAAEADVPLLADVTLFKALNVNGALRYTHYKNSGNYWTWKAGVDWDVSSELRLRATRSRDIRAPTLEDLFAPRTPFPAAATDILLGSIPSSAPDVASGNPNLTAEIGKTTTAGVIYKPSWLPRFSVSLDYFHIKIEDAILTLVGTNQVLQRACYNSGGTSPYCQLHTRALGSYTNTSAANVVTEWRRQTFNIAQIQTNGFDFEMNYATRLGGRPLSLRALATYTPHIRYVQSGLNTQDMAGVAYGQNGLQASPKWRATGFLSFSPVDSVNVSVLHRWRSSLGLVADPTLTTSGQRVKEYATTNVNVAWKLPAFGSETELYLNVQNLFDNIAPPANFFGTAANIGLFGGFPIGDDPVGRYFTAGVRVKL